MASDVYEEWTEGKKSYLVIIVLKEISGKSSWSQMALGLGPLLVAYYLWASG